VRWMQTVVTLQEEFHARTLCIPKAAAPVVHRLMSSLSATRSMTVTEARTNRKARFSEDCGPLPLTLSSSCLSGGGAVMTVSPWSSDQEKPSPLQTPMVRYLRSSIAPSRTIVASRSSATSSTRPAMSNWS
jgi:hypothetical protein